MTLTALGSLMTATQSSQNGHRCTFLTTRVLLKWLAQDQISQGSRKGWITQVSRSCQCPESHRPTGGQESAPGLHLRQVSLSCGRLFIVVVIPAPCSGINTEWVSVGDLKHLYKRWAVEAHLLPCISPCLYLSRHVCMSHLVVPDGHCMLVWV